MLQSPTLDNSSGIYYSNGIDGLGPNLRLRHRFAEANVSIEASNRELARKLWKLSEELVGLGSQS